MDFIRQDIYKICHTKGINVIKIMKYGYDPERQNRDGRFDIWQKFYGDYMG